MTSKALLQRRHAQRKKRPKGIRSKLESWFQTVNREDYEKTMAKVRDDVSCMLCQRGIHPPMEKTYVRRTRISQDNLLKMIGPDHSGRSSFLLGDLARFRELLENTPIIMYIDSEYSAFRPKGEPIAKDVGDLTPSEMMRLLQDVGDSVVEGRRKQQ